MAGRRQTLLRGALVVAVIAGVWLLATGSDPTDRASVVAARAAPAESSARLREPQATLPLELPIRRPLAPALKNLFPGPPPAVPAPPPRAEPEPVPAPPAPPPLPFTFVGSFQSEGGELVFYLAEAEKLHLVSRGDILNGVYRVESAGADRLELVYLPLQARHTLAFGAKQ
jgi:hypothetical protein